MLSGGNDHSPHAFFKNKNRFFEVKDLLFLNPIITRFESRFLIMIHTLRLKDSLRGTVHLQDFIVLKLSKE